MGNPTWPRTAAEAPGIRRPRHPERTSFYRIFERHFCEYVGTYEERFEYSSGPLRKIIVPTVEAYLDCGRLVNGFARIRCPKCGSEHLLAFPFPRAGDRAGTPDWVNTRRTVEWCTCSCAAIVPTRQCSA